MNGRVIWLCLFPPIHCDPIVNDVLKCTLFFFFFIIFERALPNLIKLCQAQRLRDFFFFRFFADQACSIHKTVLWMWGTLLCCCPMIVVC